MWLGGCFYGTDVRFAAFVTDGLWAGGLDHGYDEGFGVGGEVVIS